MSDAGHSGKTPGRYRWLAVTLSVLMPGFGHLYLGRYRRAALWMFPIVVAGIAVAVVSRWSTALIIGVALTPQTLWGLLVVDALAVVWRLAAAVDAYIVAGPSPNPGKHQRLVAVAGWMVVGVVVLVPHAGVGALTVDALILVDAVFVLQGEDVPQEPIIPIGTDADIVPDPALADIVPDTALADIVPDTALADIVPDTALADIVPDTALADIVPPELHEKEPILYLELDPDDQRWLRHLIFRDGIGDPGAPGVWSKIQGDRRNAAVEAPFLPFDERVGTDGITFLLAGGDGGPGRGGMRTDTMMVATIDVITGRAAIFGFPRNLGHTPLPSRFKNAFVDLQRSVNARIVGTEAGGLAADCGCFPEQLNALYPYTRKWTKTYPDELDPGMAFLRDTLSHVMGIQIDYYALVDMAAFVDLVDAIDGVDVYVQQPLQAEVSPPREGDPWATVDVGVGWNHLSGSEALAYARARKNSSDYVRMQRQRCMVRAVAAKADPFTLLWSFSSIVDAVEGSVVTNFPLSLAPDLLTAAARLNFDDIETVGFVHGYWERERDGLGKPVLDLGRVRAKVNQVIGGPDRETSDESIESECDA
jgi:LCP family protein required for cell wall assembly